MEALLQIFKYVVVAYIVLSIAQIAYKERKNIGFSIKVWKAIRFRMVLENVGVIILVATSAYLLHSVSFLSYGWMNLMYEEGGSIIGSPMLEAEQSKSLLIQALPIIFLVLLISVLPFLAHIEEKIFRKGVFTWKGIIIRSVVFGLVHCIMGISIGVGLGISVAGFYFAIKYKKAYFKKLHEYTEKSYSNMKLAEDHGVFVSTVCHTTYNTIIIGVGTLVTIFSLIFN